MLPLKKSSAFLFPFGAIALLWILIAAKIFTFSFYDNEYDILPYARQDVHPEWLPGDWYLNLDIEYRGVFNLLAGNLVHWFGFSNGAYITRGIGYLAVAISIYFLFRAVDLKFSFAVLCLYFFLKSQSLVAGEWIVGGAETKTFAYAFVFLTLACFLRKKYLLAFVLAGLAVSFHVLVGFYALFCLGFAILLNKEWRLEWRKILLSAWPLAITGINGVKMLFLEVFSSALPNSDVGWEIYVTYRVSHHVYPPAWGIGVWIGRLGLGILLFILFLVWRKSSVAKFLATYGLASASLFLVGLLIYASGKITLLRYYWFRFPDTMIPFLTLLLVAYLGQEILDRKLPLTKWNDKQQAKLLSIVERVLSFGVAAIFIINLFLSMAHLSQELRYLREVESTAPLQTALRWISTNTPSQAVFLIAPSIQEFYIYAERPVFVTWKNAPQKSADLIEWFQRIRLCNGGHMPQQSSYASNIELQDNFYNLNENQINQIAQTYKIEYYLGSPQQDLSFERVYSNSSFTLYKLEQSKQTP